MSSYATTTLKLKLERSGTSIFLPGKLNRTLDEVERRIFPPVADPGLIADRQKDHEFYSQSATSLLSLRTFFPLAQPQSVAASSDTHVRLTSLVRSTHSRKAETKLWRTQLGLVRVLREMIQFQPPTGHRGWGSIDTRLLCAGLALWAPQASAS